MLQASRVVDNNLKSRAALLVCITDSSLNVATVSSVKSLASLSAQALQAWVNDGSLTNKACAL